MIDRGQLREALVDVDDLADGSEPETFRYLVEAARLVAQGQEVWWCEEHNHNGGKLGIGCLVKSVWPDKSECRIERRLLLGVDAE